MEVPSYRLYKPRNTACVDIAGKRFYLGTYGSPESRDLYNRLIAEWFKNGRNEPPRVQASNAITTQPFVSAAHIAATYIRYLRIAQPTSPGRFRNFHNVRVAMQKFRDHLRWVDCQNITAHHVEMLQFEMANCGWAHATVRDRMNIVKAAIKRAVKMRIIPVSVRAELEDVDALRRDFNKLKPTRKVPPVPDHTVEATVPFLSSVVAAMVRFQWLTGARPGEVCMLRPVDLDTKGTVWVYRLPHHKTEHLGKDRTIMIGPAAQRILKPFLIGRSVDAFLFSPVEADAERRARRLSQRKTPLHHGNSTGTNVTDNPRRQPGAHYTTGTYRLAIQRACDRAGIDRWHPNQLRHAAATRLRREGGLEIAAMALGHSSATLTDQVYAERDHHKLLGAIERLG